MGFSNDGGILDKGTCWWHSRFERSAAYLAVFRPDLPKPNASQIEAIVAGIINHQFVTVPGYIGLFDFTNENHTVVQRALNQWQLSEAARGLNTLFLSHQMRGKKLWKRMNYIFNEFAKKHAMLFLEINMKGFGAHSLLVHDIIRRGDGYGLRVSDSNFQGQILEIEYAKGDRSLRLIVDGHDVYGAFIPYLDESRELARIDTVYASLCGHGVPTGGSTLATVANPIGDTDAGEGEIERSIASVPDAYSVAQLFGGTVVPERHAPNSIRSVDGLLPVPQSEDVSFEQAFTRPRADEYDPHQIFLTPRESDATTRPMPIRPMQIQPVPTRPMPISRALGAVE